MLKKFQGLLKQYPNSTSSQETIKMKYTYFYIIHVKGLLVWPLEASLCFLLNKETNNLSWEFICHNVIFCEVIIMAFKINCICMTFFRSIQKSVELVLENNCKWKNVINNWKIIQYLGSTRCMELHWEYFSKTKK